MCDALGEELSTIVKIEIDVPNPSPRLWQETKTRALAAIEAVKKILSEKKEEIRLRSGQGSALRWANLLPETGATASVRSHGYIPSCDPIGLQGKPSTHVVGPLGEGNNTHCLIQHRNLLAVAMVLETIVANPEVVENAVWKSVE